MGRIMPLIAPAFIRRFTGLPSIIKTIVDKTINPLIMSFSFLETAGTNVFQKETEVYEAQQLK